LPSPRAATKAVLRSIGSADKVVLQHGRLGQPACMNGWNGTTAKPIACGTKSFACALVATAEADGLLTPDPQAASRIPAWAPGGARHRQHRSRRSC
jgi:hypothetical protein